MNYQALKFQIGKNGITPGVIEAMNTALKTHKQMRISVLKSSGRTRESMEEMAKSIQSQLVEKCDYKIMGFTIILIKKLNRNPHNHSNIQPKFVKE